MALRFGELRVVEKGGPVHKHRPVTSPNYVLHVTVDEIDTRRTLCGKRIGRGWPRRNVLTKAECEVCPAMQASRYES